MVNKFHSILLFISFLFSCTAYANIISGLVIKISDGDTLTILTKDNVQLKIRLSEVDAPEKKQPFGNKSKQSLSNLCFNKVAIVDILKIDRYGRSVGRVKCDNVDANEYQVKNGLAWVYDKYVTDHSLYALQEQAKSKGIGLWSEKSPIPPWIFRHN
ncbi:TPA: thermonuclease family protein [Legionella pneumophila]|nr:thermonuclease family protein [Legionella pneumophila]HAU0696909.1 thermonuclease family protein [Legionella pneumophila]HAU0873254.1 thermonuclease family protein [Legionella pneumophila]HDO7799097.1 thermonuclease family protein [Legionella pneumophila]HDO7969631.1 thermonuclease family protein [Legionella pneumophila]